MTTNIVVGMDPAAKQDWCAIATVAYDTTAQRGRALNVVRLRGLAFESLAPLLIESGQRVAGSIPTGARLALVIDGTGIGQQPAEQVAKKAKTDFATRPPFKSVVLTGGAKVTKGTRPYEVNASRQMLVAQFVMAVNSGHFDLTGLDDESKKMVAAEMKSFTRTNTASGRERLEHSAGHHDDILFALALAWWMASTLPAGGSSSALGKVVQRLTKKRVAQPLTRQLPAPPKPRLAAAATAEPVLPMVRRTRDGRVAPSWGRADLR